MSGRSDDRPEHGTHSQIEDLSGRAVQARDVHGGVHFHGRDRAAEPVPRQLPSDVHGFVNRVGELETLSSHLTAHHGAAAVHVIVGTAGVGKTALALRWAHRVRNRFPDGQLYANMRGYDPGPPVSPDQVLHRFLRAMGVPSDAVPPDEESRSALLRSLVADRRVLMVLDNAAHAAQVRPLLPGSSGCMVLVTSRDRLSGLVARDGALRLTLSTLSLDEAVALLETVTDQDRDHDAPDEVAELARLCARLPLALRIAAERAASRPHMPLGDLIDDLRDESGLWEALAVDDDEEADAVRTVFAWSYRALPRESARLFRLLGLHPTPDFDTRAAAALAAIPVRAARRRLDALTGAHLLEQIGPDHYQFHDLLRSYAVDQVQHEETEQDRLRCLERLLDWYLYSTHAAVRAMDSHLRPLSLPPREDLPVPVFSDNAEAVRWYEVQRRSLVAAAETAASAGLHETAWRLPAVLGHIHAFHAPVTEWIASARIGVDSARRVGSARGEADLLDSLGMAHVQAGSTAEALACHSAALELHERGADPFGQAVSLNGIGLVHLRGGRPDQALPSFERCLAIARERGERRWEGIALANLADAVLDTDRPADALDLAEQAFAVHRETGNRMSAFSCLVTLSDALQALNRRNEAVPHLWRALEIAQELDNPIREAYALVELGGVQVEGGQAGQALESFHEAAALYRRTGDQVREATAVEGTGRAYQALGRHQDAAAFLRRAVSVYRHHDHRRSMARCLNRLAASLEATGDTTRAEESRAEARAL
ncbi:ATP-binding protein [Nocardiopsis aegyptia]|uniref:ATP-binding protein n=1 Tax=Nocardiopsis aegyptia TaxID=220378 RepID=UPI00366C0869